MARGLAVENGNTLMASEPQMYQKGVKHLCDNGLNKLPSKYILPNSDRPDTSDYSPHLHVSGPLQLPLIDFAQLLGPNRHHVIHSLTKACQEYGFFQVSS